jgi:hypothetical protein
MDSADTSRSQTLTLDELLAACARPAPAGPEGEKRAVAAFRAARDEGSWSTSPRRTDDWRAAEPRVRTGWIKAGLGTFVVGLTLGGVAMAAGAIPTPFGGPQDRPRPAPSASSGPGEQTPGSGPSASSTAGPATRTPDVRPSTAKDRLAHCRVYEAKQGQGRAALDSTALQRLEDAAGGPDAVAAYCARLLSEQLPGQSSTSPQPKDKDKDKVADPLVDPPADGEKDAPPTPAGRPDGRGMGQGVSNGAAIGLGKPRKADSGSGVLDCLSFYLTYMPRA